MEAITPAQILRVGALGFLSGVGAFSFFPSLWGIDLFIITSVAPGIFLLLWVVPLSQRRLILFVVFALFGIIRLLIAFPQQLVTIDSEGIVQEVRSKRFGAVDLLVHTPKMKILLTQVRGRFSYGDAVRVSCTPEPIEDRRGGALD